MKLIKKYKYELILFLLTSFLSLFILAPYIFSNKEFVIGWDMRVQYSSFFEELKTMFTKIPFYSFNYFLGNNFYSSKLFYYHDIFDYIFAFSKLNYYKVILIQTYIKLIIASFSFYIYSRYNKFSFKTSIISSLCFCFSSYILEQIKDPFFLSFTVFTPIYFMYIDKFIKEKKKIGFIIITTFLIITNYYLFYSLSVFTVIYFIYRYYSLNNSFKNIIKNALYIIFHYMIAILLSSFATIPQFYNIISNSRVGSKSVLFLYDSFKPYLNLVLSIFTPFNVFVNRQTEISKLFFETTKNNSVLALYLFSCSLQSFLLPQIIFNNKRKEKIVYMILFLLIVIPLGSSLMHGFSEPSFRWIQFIVFFNISLSLPFIENFNIINKNILKYTLLFFILSTVIIYPILIVYQKSYLTVDYVFVIVFLLFIILTFYSLLKDNYKLCILIMIVELAFSSLASFCLNPYYFNFDKKTVNSIHHTLLNKNDLNNHLLSLDENNKNLFFRVFVDKSSVYWDYSTNLNLDYNFKGLMTYDSTVSSSLSSMNNFINISSYLPWSYEINDNRLLNLLSVKYAITNNNVPFKNFKKVSEFNYFSIYENMDYVNFGKTYTNITNKFDINLINFFVVSNNVDEIKKYLGNEEKEIDFVKVYDNKMYLEINTNSKGFLVLSLPYDDGFSVFVNYNKVKTFDVNGGLIGFPIESGFNEINISFIPKGLKQGLLFSFVGFILFLIVFIKDKFMNKQSF